MNITKIIIIIVVIITAANTSTLLNINREESVHIWYALRHVPMHVITINNY